MAENGILIFAAIYEFSIFAIGLVLAVSIFQRYIARKKKPTLYLAITYLSLLLGTLSSGIGRVLRITELAELPSGNTLEFLAFAVTFVILSDVFYFAFWLEVFHDTIPEKKRNLAVLVFGLCGAVAIVYILLTGLFAVDLTTGIWMVVVVFSVFVYVLLIRDAWKLSHKMDTKLAKVSILLIAISPILLLLCFAFFFIDRMMGGDFTPFYIPAWGFALTSVVTAYIGYLQPEWFKKRMEK